MTLSSNDFKKFNFYWKLTNIFRKLDNTRRKIKIVLFQRKGRIEFLFCIDKLEYTMVIWTFNSLAYTHKGRTQLHKSRVFLSLCKLINVLPYFNFERRSIFPVMFSSFDVQRVFKVQ